MFFKSLKQVRENKEGEELKKVSVPSGLLVTENVYGDGNSLEGWRG